MKEKMFKFGDIVIFSEEGLKELRPHAYNRTRKGLIAGTRTEGNIIVIWKNTRMSYLYDKRFIQKFNEDKK